MGEVQYDDAAADLLAQAVSNAASTLRVQGGAPRAAAPIERMQQGDLHAWQVRHDERTRAAAPSDFLRRPGLRGVARPSIGVGVMLTAALLVSGCSNAPGGNAVDPSEAKKSIVDAVKESTDAVGGEWTVYRGPAAEVCTQSGGGDGARFVYVLERSRTDGTDPAADIRTVEELWKSKGITTKRFESGGSDPLTGIRGADGPVTSIGFNAYPQRYSITGVSECSDGDVQDLRSAE
ncbi:hypothetical protein [Curtobacterium sp. MCJR17_020]|uniref:hypothetical protein n=1 Tax=Curtobacterium sp. MCJR17_020 TaxID=2175619 RepID=UPI0024DFBF60|nr:hypothetical protein [Curtobacterium sp. MCJR17_020]WIE73420.1 hypothetical protein DEJ14_006510 [Curtobacterium sp. MCJR17_020]